VSLAQRTLDHQKHTIWIAKYLIVPDADNAIPFVFDHLCSGCVRSLVMLSAIDFDDELRAVTSEVRNEVTQRHLPTKMMLPKAFAQHAPDGAFRIGHFASQATCPNNSAMGRMMLQT